MHCTECLLRYGKSKSGSMQKTLGHKLHRKRRVLQQELQRDRVKQDLRMTELAEGCEYERAPQAPSLLNSRNLVLESGFLRTP